MGSLSRIVFLICVIFSACFSSVVIPSVAFASGEICSANLPCEEGLACVGNVGLEGTGTCVAAGPHVVLCNIVEYFDSKLATVFAIFAVVMIGIAFFLGKISWGMIVSVILGIGIIKGATSIIKKVSGQNSGYCSQAQNSASSTDPSCYSQIDAKQGTNHVFNTSEQGQKCQTPLSCIKKTCQSGSIVGTAFILEGTTHTAIAVNLGGTSSTYLPTSESAYTVTTCTKTQWEGGTTQCSTYSATCSPMEQNEQRDYYYCSNNCDNSKVVRYDTAGKYSSCTSIFGLTT